MITGKVNSARTMLGNRMCARFWPQPPDDGATQPCGDTMCSFTASRVSSSRPRTKPGIDEQTRPTAWTTRSTIRLRLPTETTASSTPSTIAMTWPMTSISAVGSSDLPTSVHTGWRGGTSESPTLPVKKSPSQVK